MTKLNCTVTSCVHNCEKLCNLGSIKVEGNSADVSDATSCASFKERKSDSYSNETGKKPSHNSVIECMAHKCVYNEDCNCTATHIDVAGDGANNFSETRCATFTCKEK